MPDGRDQFTARLIGAIGTVDPDDWDRCAGRDNPFVSHAFLHALEESGSVGDRSGWWPQHLILQDADESIIGCMPLYLKNNSYGEYVLTTAGRMPSNKPAAPIIPSFSALYPLPRCPGRACCAATIRTRLSSAP